MTDRPGTEAAPSWWRRPEVAPFLVLALAWFALNSSLLLGKRVLPWDAMDQFYPTVFFNAHSLRHGLAPWWNPYVYSGYPQIADPQGMLFSPLLMTWMLIPSSPGATWFAWGILLHVLLGACAMLALLRGWRANTFGALAGALVYMAGGVAASRLEHVPIVLAYAYAPVALLMIRRFIDAPGWRRGLVLGVAMGALLTHLVQLTYLLTFVLAAYGAIATARRWSGYGRGERGQWLLGLCLAAVVALAMSLPQLLFSLAFVWLSNRAELPLSAASGASLDGRAFLTLFSPNALHALSGAYSGPADLVEAFLYIGAVPMLLLLWLGKAWRQPEQRATLLFFTGLAAVAILYMLGTHTGFYGWLYGWLPGMKQFRRPSDAAYLLNLALAVLVGLAASHHRLDSRHHNLVLLGVAGAWLLFSCLALHEPGSRWKAAMFAAPLFALVAAWLAARRASTSAAIALALLALVVIDYRSFNLNGSFNEGRDGARSLLREDAVKLLVKESEDRSRLLPPRIEPVDILPGWDNLIVLPGLRSTQGYNPLRYSLYASWYAPRDNGNQPWQTTPYHPGPGSVMSRLLGAEYVVRDTRLKRSLLPPPAGYERILQGDIEVWRSLQPAPRLLNPTIARLADAPPAPEIFGATDFNETLWLMPRDADARNDAVRDSVRCTGRLQLLQASATPTRLSVKTQSEATPGWLVLSELDFPGWRASVDGADLPIHRANGMFRAVCVPAGEHVVEFRFHPWRMVADAWRQRHTVQTL